MEFHEQMMISALLPILQSRPADPVAHLAASLGDVAAVAALPGDAPAATTASAAAATAHRWLRLCAPESAAFEDNVFAAFRALVGAGAGGDDCAAPDAFEELAALLTAGLPPQLGLQLQRVREACEGA